MKSIYLQYLTLLGLILFNTKESRSQWTTMPTGVATSLSKVYFVNADTGFIATSSRIIKTQDGGNTWQDNLTGNIQINHVGFLNESLGFASGYDILNSQASIFKTANGGNSWSQTNLPTNRRILDMDFPSTSIGYGVGYNGIAVKTLDGGATWDTLDLGVTGNLYSVDFTSNAHGVVVGSNSNESFILETNDTGKTWNNRNPFSGPVFPVFRSVYFPSDSIGYIVGYSGVIIRTEDGGSTWTALSAPNTLPYFDVFFINNSVGYIAGGNSGNPSILKTTDGGNTWYSSTSPANVAFSSIHFPSDSIGYVAGSGGTLMKTTNAINLKIDRNKIDADHMDVLNISPNPVYDKLYFSGNIDSHILIELYDLKGNLLRKDQLYKSENTMDFTSIKPGAYLLNIHGGPLHRIHKLIKI